MVLVYHDFFENYLSADGAKDSVLKENVVLTEIAKIIAVFPDKAAEILNKSGVPVSKDVDLTTMSNLIEQHAPTNTKLQLLLAQEVINGNDEFNGKKYYSVGGDSSGGGGGGGATSGGSKGAGVASGLASEENIGALAGIIGSVAGMFKSKKKNKKNKEAAKKTKSLADFVQQQKFQFLKAQGLLTQERVAATKEENKWKPLITVAAVIVGFSVLGFGLTYYLKTKQIK